ncbi:MAG: 6,7-dimethyl-8-ribityllumazine synthase [Gammaproteobacteria bacterium]|nr:6,7-dimethyl-8-ribityllumazine synthase [Gammaproteobacteria bacterium]
MSVKIAIVVSEFNRPITDELLLGCKRRLEKQGVVLTDHDIKFVPGAVELPLIAQQYARQDYQAVICLGAVIRGETSHYDYVCQQASYGCQRVALTENIPVIFGVLTTENIAQAQDRLGGKKGHKGIDAADAALAMIDCMKSLKDVAHV